MKSWQPLAVLFAIVAASLGRTGCHSTPDHPPTRVNIIFDTTVEKRLSVSRSREATLLSRLGREDRAALYTLDQSCTEVYSPDQALPSGLDNTLLMLVKRIKPSPLRGTFPHNAWKKQVEEIQHDSRPTVLVWETDGDEDQSGEAARRETQSAIKKLASLPQLRLVVLVGINQEQRQRVRAELAPFGKRCAILEQDSPTNQLVETVQGAIYTTVNSASKGGAQ